MSSRFYRATILPSLALLAICLALPAHSQQAPEEAGKAAASNWLALIDSGQWQSAMHASRDPLGKVLSRKVKSAAFKTELPGAPDGQYVVIQYDTSFEHKQSALETVTPMLDRDGKWRVSGYYIK